MSVVTLDQLLKELAVVNSMKEAAASGTTFFEVQVILINKHGWTWGKAENFIQQCEEIGKFTFPRDDAEERPQ